jgi:ribosome-associated protein
MVRSLERIFMTSQKPASSSSTSSVNTLIEDPSRKTAFDCVRAALDKKAENLKLLDLTELSSFTEYFVICSGTSDRQVQAIADAVANAMKQESIQCLSQDGYSEGRWVVMDFGVVVVHVFLDALREYYDLENLWSEAPRVKIPSEFYGHAASRLN